MSGPGARGAASAKRASTVHCSQARNSGDWPQRHQQRQRSGDARRRDRDAAVSRPVATCRCLAARPRLADQIDGRERGGRPVRSAASPGPPAALRQLRREYAR